MKNILTLIFLLILGISKAHAYYRDSLWAVYNNKSLHDTVRLNAIYDLGRSYQITTQTAL